MNQNLPLYFSPINRLGNSAFRNVCLNHGADFAFTEMIKIEDFLENKEYQIRKLENISEKYKSRTFVQIIAKDLNLIEIGIEKILDYFPQVKEINYNMGCPQSSLCKNECGAGILNNPILVGKVAKILFKSCWKNNIIPSIKLRLGIDRKNITILKNIDQIKKAGINKVYIHGRVLKDTYIKPATYSEIGLVKKKFPDMQIIANGDVINFDSFSKIIEQTNCDGVLIGRAALENPFIFEQIKLKNKNINNLSGLNFYNRLPQIMEFIENCLSLNIPISHIKSNLSYMTKGVINSADFRRNINNLNKVNLIYDYIKKIYLNINLK